MKGYRLFCGKTTDGSVSLKSYGIILPCGDIVEDITFDKKAAEELVRQLNDNDVSVLHAMDIIEDFLFKTTTAQIKYLC